MNLTSRLAMVSLGIICAASSALADAQCEKKILATGMVSMKGDEAVACEQNPSPAAQECMVDLLTHGKGKLRNQDFVEIIGLCLVDPSKEVRDCTKSKINKPWNDPGYKGVKLAGDECLASRKAPGVTYLGKPPKMRPKRLGQMSPLPGQAQNRASPAGNAPAPANNAPAPASQPAQTQAPGSASGN